MSPRSFFRVLSVFAAVVAALMAMAAAHRFLNHDPSGGVPPLLVAAVNAAACWAFRRWSRQA